MNWDRVIRAGVAGEPAALAQLISVWMDGRSDDLAACAALLIAEEAPHAPAALVVAGLVAHGVCTRPVVAALAPYVAPALAEWRADPDRAARRIRRSVRRPAILGVARLVAALHHHPVALRDAIGIVARDGDDAAIDGGLAALGIVGWGLLDDATRATLYARALRACPAALGGVWSALPAAQQAEVAGQAERTSDDAAALIGRIGAAAWGTTDAVLRQRLIAAAAQGPFAIERSAPAWTGMTHAERRHLATAVMEHGDSDLANRLLTALGCDGRRALSPAQRDALAALAAQDDVWNTALLRLADGGRDAVGDGDWQALMTRSAASAWSAAVVIRTVGIVGWTALPLAEQEALRAAVQQDALALVVCPPALWIDLSGGRDAPPAPRAAAGMISWWSAADADADLSDLPAAHRSLVLALAPWRTDDLAPQSPRMARLIAAWDGMTADERVDLAEAQPWMAAVVAAVARLCDCARTTAAVGDTLTTMAQRSVLHSDARKSVGRLLATQRGWRPWMRAFAPTDADRPDVWEEWRRAARRGAVTDRAIVLNVMMRDNELRARRC